MTSKSLPYIVLCFLLLLNAFTTYRFARFVSIVDLYRKEVSELSYSVHEYTTNVLSYVAGLPQSLAPGQGFQNFTSESSTAGTIPLRYCVIRGVSGLTSGGLSWYPVGSPTPYGVLDFATRDFARFDGSTYYHLSHD